MDEPPPPPYYSAHDSNPCTPTSTIPSPNPSAGEPSPPRDGLDGADGDGDGDGDEHIPFVSGAAYSAMRPPQLSRLTHILSYLLTFLQGATPKSIDFSRPEQNLLDRDVDRQDWATFLNHLLLHPNHDEDIATSSLERQVSPSESRSPQIRLDQSTINEADVDSKSVCGVSALTRAVKAGDEESEPLRFIWPSQREALLLIHGSDFNAKPSGGEPALYLAASKSHLDIVQLLLEYGADVDATPPGGEAALYRALSKGESELMRLLIDYGANPNGNPPGGKPSLYRAASKSNLDIVQLLLDRKWGLTVDADSSQKKANIEKKPSARRSALQCAASRGETNVVEDTALYNAVSKGYYDTIQLLLDCGASIDAPGGKSALVNATRKGDEQIVRLLLQGGNRGVVRLGMPSEEYGALPWNFHRLFKPSKPSKSHFMDPNTMSKPSGTSVLTSGVGVTKALETVDLAQARPEYTRI
ncbi:hypothetical protein MMC29_005704 [Sticta canariensis]|nr:hypothetical protein [Sticta canariensis]